MDFLDICEAINTKPFLFITNKDHENFFQAEFIFEYFDVYLFSDDKYVKRNIILLVSYYDTKRKYYIECDFDTILKICEEQKPYIIFDETKATVLDLIPDALNELQKRIRKNKIKRILDL